jgi:hypothetical protein
MQWYGAAPRAPLRAERRVRRVAADELGARRDLARAPAHDADHETAGGGSRARKVPTWPAPKTTCTGAVMP